MVQMGKCSSVVSTGTIDSCDRSRTTLCRLGTVRYLVRNSMEKAKRKE